MTLVVPAGAAPPPPLPRPGSAPAAPDVLGIRWEECDCLLCGGRQAVPLVRAPDFDPATRFYAVANGRPVGYINYQLNGRISFQGWIWRVGKAFRGERIALRPTITDGVFSVHYCTHQVGTIDVSSQPAPAQDGEQPITFSTSYPQPTTTAEG